MKRLFLLLTLLFLARLGFAADSSPFELYGLSLCSDPQYKCIRVHSGATWEKLFPNAASRELVMRLNRYDGDLKYRAWLVVPKSLKNKTYMDVAPMPRKINPPGEKFLYVDLRVSAYGAYDAQGNLLQWGPASGGKEWCDGPLKKQCVTASGLFHIYRKQGENCVSNTYPGDDGKPAKMPFCMYFFQGEAIHGSPMYGFTDSSHGCVRVFTEDAKWLNQNFVQLGTKVLIIR
jgi:lipoprotein-anchoring transpeptidase ErfK/SrfK